MTQVKYDRAFATFDAELIPMSTIEGGTDGGRQT